MSRQWRVWLGFVVVLGACGGGGKADGDVPLLDEKSAEVAADTVGFEDIRGVEDLPGAEEVLEVTEPAADTTSFPALPNGAGVVLAAQGDLPVAPFPFDWFTTPDPASPTGLRLSIAGEGYGNRLLEAVLNMVPSYGDDAVRLDGFGAVGMVVLPVNTPLEATGLPAASGPGEPVEVFRITADGAESVPFALATAVYELDDGEPLHAIELEPIGALCERSEYLVLVRRGLTDAAGEPFAPFPMTRVLLGLQPPYGPSEVAQRLAALRDRTMAALAKVPEAPPPEELAAAVLYTVGTMTADMQQAADLVRGEEFEFDLDPDGDGADNLLAPDDYGPFGATPPDYVSMVVEARFRVPDFRDETGFLGLDQDGEISIHGYQWRDFYLVLPAQPREVPVPLVIFQHGINSYKETELSVAKELAERGFAAAAFDFVYHEKGSETAGFKFIQIDAPNLTVGNFRQTALDILSFHEALKQLGQARDLIPGNGAGEPDIDLDRIIFAGHSLGALESTMTSAISDGKRAAGLIAGGGNFRHLFEVFLKSKGLWDLFPSKARVGFKVLANHLMSPADPASYAPLLTLRPPEDGSPAPFLLLAAMSDETIPPECAHAATLALGSPIIEPVEVLWPWATTAPAEGRTSGTVQFQGGHEFFNGGDGPDTRKLSRELFYHWVETFMDSGVPEILWPVE